MKNLLLFLAITFAAVFVSAPVLAHHGETNYDTEKLVTVKATVTKWRGGGWRRNGRKVQRCKQGELHRAGT